MTSASNPTRYPRLLSQDAQSYPMPRNAFWHAFENEFRTMFRSYEGIADTPEQSDWYVMERWNAYEDRETVEWDSPEARLLRFISEPIGPSYRRIRVISGATGCGKTTFINHFFHDYLPKKHPDLYDSLFILIIDCHDAAQRAEDLEQDIDHRINLMLLEPRYSWLEELPHCIDMWLSEVNFDSGFYRELWKDLPPELTEQRKLEWIDERRKGLHHRNGNGSPFHDFNRVRLNYLADNFDRKLIVVWDNIDHAPLEVQKEALRLARHKLQWIPNQKIVVTVREYARTRVESELPTAAFAISTQPLYPPPIHRVLQARAGSSIEALESKLVTGDVSVTVQHGKKFLQSVLLSFREPENQKIMTRLSNSNLRMQLEMVQQVLKSGHIASSSDVLDAISRHFETPERHWRILWADLLEALICGDYRFRYRYESFVLNVYDASNVIGFYNTLNVHYVLQIVDRHESGIAPGEIALLLQRLGHPTAVTETTIQRLLNDNQIWSEQGRSLADDNINYVKPTVVGSYYLNELMLKLMYLQHMGLVTPLDPRYVRRLRLWSSQDFTDRIRGAWALSAQIRDDEESQWAYARDHGAEALEVMNEYGFGRLRRMLRTHAKRELIAIRDSKPSSIDLNRDGWSEVIRWFCD